MDHSSHETRDSRPAWQPLPTGTESGTVCPDCRSGLVFAMLAGYKIACCEACGGMLIQRSNLGTIINRCRSEWKTLDVALPPPDPSRPEPQTFCPACLGAMETYPYIGPGRVVIDACPACDMVWMNSGEFDRIVQAPGKRAYQAADLAGGETGFSMRASHGDA